MRFHFLLSHLFHGVLGFQRFILALLDECVHLCTMFIDEDGHDLAMVHLKRLFEFEVIVELDRSRDQSGTSYADVMLLGECLVFLVHLACEDRRADGARFKDGFDLGLLRGLFILVVRSHRDDVLVAVHIDIACLYGRVDEQFKCLVTRLPDKVEVCGHDLRVLVDKKHALYMAVLVKDELNTGVDLQCHVGCSVFIVFQCTSASRKCQGENGCECHG